MLAPTSAVINFFQGSVDDVVQVVLETTTAQAFSNSGCVVRQEPLAMRAFLYEI